MNSTCEIISVSRGFKSYESVDFTDIVTAFDTILAGKQQYKYSYVEIMDGGQVKMVQNLAVCPSCAQLLFAYKHYITGIKPKKRLTRDILRHLAVESTSLFEPECQKIELYEPIKTTEKMKCVHCGYESTFNDKKTLVTIRKRRSKVIVTYPLNDLSELFAVKWSTSMLSINEFPICEEVQFNFKKGTTCISMKTPSGKTLAALDFTNGIPYDVVFSSPLINLIGENTVIKRKLRDIFADIWGVKLPFKEEELDIIRFSFATTYVGYDNPIFYSSIPINPDTMLFDMSYKAMREKMRFAKNILPLFEESSLENKKFIKRTMLENPSRFFYLKEAEAVWDACNHDINFFNSFIIDDKAERILSFIHDCPGVLILFRDICDDEFYVPFKNMLLSYPEEVCDFAVRYAASSDEKRRFTRNKIRRTNCKILRTSCDNRNNFLEIAPPHMISQIPTQKVNSYLFSPLKTPYEFLQCGYQLSNCLGHEVFDDTVIVGVMKNGRYVAAIQVDTEHNTIIQAQLKNNKTLDNDKFVFASFEKWCKCRGYTYEEEDICDFDFNNL